MKKIKQVLAILGIICLVALYVLTLIAAIFDSTKTMSYLTAAVWATIVIPVMIWVIEMLYKQIKPKDSSDAPQEDEPKTK